MKFKTLTIVLLSFSLLSCAEHRFDPRAVELNNQAVELLVVMDESSQREAEVLLRQALEIDPSYHLAAANLIILYLSWKDYESALSVAEGIDPGAQEYVRDYRNFHLFLLADKLDKPEIADPAYEALLEGMSTSNIQEIETDRLLHYATILSLRREEHLEVLELYLKEIALRTDVVDKDLVSSLRSSTSAELKESYLGN